jgi:signal transduction histidine kinase
VPIAGKNDVLGLLYAQSDNLIAPMTKEDATFASAVANELALNIESIRFQAKALKNERMAGIGLTIGNLAHNIKNLIALNQSASQLMDSHIARSGDDQIEKYWQWMQQGLSGISQLSTDILDYVKEDQFLNRPTDINKAIKKYRHSLERRFSHEGISFEFVLSAENPVWVIDEIQFQRALLNLVINAVDAINDKKRGKIRISTALKANRCLTVSVIDNGCGIPSSKMDKVLDLFFTTKGTRGTGLGLAMVQKFIEKAGGKLTFKSKEGIGSKFQMIFIKD